MRVGDLRAMFVVQKGAPREGRSLLLSRVRVRRARGAAARGGGPDANEEVFPLAAPSDFHKDILEGGGWRLWPQLF